MPSRDRGRRRGVGLAAVCLAAMSLAATSLAGGAAADAGPRASPAAVRQAVAGLRQDSNLGRAGKTHVLTWVGSDDPVPDVQAPGWLRRLLGGLGVSGRLVVWAAAAAGAGLLVIYLLRLAQTGAGPGRLPPLAPPTHVRELDIRPESLPADIGAAALSLWEEGRWRAALALLYRGMLSRLVHRHAAPIRASSTEEECARLAAPHLADAQLEFVRRLIRVWQDAVYGGAPPSAEGFRALCAQLDAALPPAPGGPA